MYSRDVFEQCMFLSNGFLLALTTGRDAFMYNTMDGVVWPFYFDPVSDAIILMGFG